VGAALGPRDVLVAGYGEHAFAAASGLRLGSLPLPRAGQYHARAGLGLDPAVRFLRGVDFGPSRVAVVGSLAVEDRLRSEDRRVLCVVRDAEVEAEDFLEVLGVAIEWRLPVVFVCSYNQYRPLAARALDEASRCAGPRVVEALTYYPEGSIESLPPACDPVQLLRRHGVAAGVLTPAEFEEVHRAALDAGASEALRWREAQAARVTG
jgi:TPP-dependent pyruvate/acetoin dehydrogenase alpha subunit